MLDDLRTITLKQWVTVLLAPLWGLTFVLGVLYAFAQTGFLGGVGWHDETDY